jgi:hypothetical protein
MPLVRLSSGERLVRPGRPKNTAIEIIDKLKKEINACLADPKIKARTRIRWA